MDPEATLEQINELLCDIPKQPSAEVYADELEEVSELASYMQEWLDRGGYAPDDVDDVLQDVRQRLQFAHN